MITRPVVRYLRHILPLLLVLVVTGCGTVRGATPSTTTSSQPDGNQPPPQAAPEPALAAALPGKFVLVRDGNLWVVQGSSPAVQLQTKRGVYYTHPVWSPDGQNVVAVEQGMNHSDIVLLSSTGAYIRSFTDYRNPVNHLASSWAYFPTWSPDGKNIAYITDKNTTGGRYMQLYIITPEGQIARRTPYYFDRLAAMEWPKWSPDGKTIILTGWPWVKGPSQIFQVDLTTGVFTQLTNSDSGANDGAWSPDGKKIAYTQRTNGQHDIWIMEIATKRAQQVTTTGSNRQPVWLNDTTLAYLSLSASGAEIWSLTVTDSGGRFVPGAPQQHTDFSRTGREAIDTTGGLSWFNTR